MKTRNIREFHRPRQMDEALRLLARPDVATVPIGGASDLIARGGREAKAVVDLRELGLSYVRRDADALHIGATTTLQALIDTHESAQAWRGELARVVAMAAARNLREQGTLGGTLVSAEGNHPLAAMLLALNASVVIASQRREMPATVSLDEFYPRRDELLTDSLITEVIVPLPRPGEAAAFEKVSRTPADRPIVCAAVRVRIENGIGRDVRVALGGVNPNPIRAARVERDVEGRPLDSLSIELTEQDLVPPSDFVGSSEYRRDMAAVLTRRAFARLRHS